MKKLRAVLIISGMFLLCAAFSFAGSKVYTDADISGYTPPKESDSERHERERSMQEEGRQDSWSYSNWCNQGEYYRDRIRDAERNIERYEKELNESQSSYRSEKFWKKDEYVSDSSVKNAEYNLNWAKESKDRAEEELRDLENRAHTSGVPPGWVRCQK
jgi:predicted RNase H-like nuclease (RuvC/YqgF family)